MEKSLSKSLECKKRFEFDSAKRLESGVICGIDEAGRGPWVGDVYAAAVVFDDDVFIDGLNDSKKISENNREILYKEIILRAKAYCIATASVAEIENLNILNASLLAMKRAISGLNINVNLALVDGNQKPDIFCKAETIIKGDSISASVAAASILAKVARDHYMNELHKEYPEYNFIRNKGYGTNEHIKAIYEHGVTPLHRPSFLRKQEAKLGEFKKR